MLLTYLGAALFCLPHVFSSLSPATRDSLKRRLGEGPFKGLFSALAGAGLVLLVLGYVWAEPGTAAAEVVKEPWTKGLHLYMLVVLVAFILLAAAQGKSHIRLWVRHPMSLGIMLWAGSHLLANGERGLMWLFGSLFLVGLFDFVFSLVRGKNPKHTPEWRSDIKAVVIGTLVYLVFLFGFHPYVLGVPLIP